MQDELYVTLQQIGQQRQLPQEVLIGIREVLESGNSADFLKTLRDENRAEQRDKPSTESLDDLGITNESCGSQDADSLECDGEPAWKIWKWLAGCTLFLFLTLGGIFWHYPDHVLGLIPQPLRKSSLCFSGSHPPSKVLAYRVDCWLSTQKYSKALSLLFLTLVLAVLGGLAIFVVSGANLYNALWDAVAGLGYDWTFASNSEGILTRIVATIISVGGLLVTAVMLSIVSEAIGDKFEEMRRGLCEVLETDHTLILGWSDKLLPVVSELCLANESIGGAPIVIMAERDKEEMEAEISQHGLNARGSRVICRSGNPLLKNDLIKVSCHLARSIIVLANQQSPDQSDARVLRIVLSLAAFRDDPRAKGGLKGHIVVEMCDIDNEPLLKMIGKDKVETVVAHDIIGRMMILCGLQPGLASVWQSLMGFEGCEFYMREWQELHGKCFGEALYRFAAAVPIGIKKPSGSVLLKPNDETIIMPGDQLLVLAEDENTYDIGKEVQFKPTAVPATPPLSKPEKILFCGWRRDMDDMIVVLDSLVPPDSQLWLYNEVKITERKEMLFMGGLDLEAGALKNLTLHYMDPSLEGDLVSRKKLSSLDPGSFSSILILADESANGANIADADSRNLTTLLLLRDIMMKTNGCKPAPKHSRWPSLEMIQTVSRQAGTVIISEILDSRTKNLIQELSISEFVMSNELVSMVLAMVAESAAVNKILKELCGGDGNELYVYSIEKYMHKGEKLSFFELMARARGCDEILIGLKYRDARGLVLNPPEKSKKAVSPKSVESAVVIGMLRQGTNTSQPSHQARMDFDQV
eukprot:evm.model.scf_769.2 EVM.evm.TU.scf_769.2   scf_769:22581-30531(-)